MLESVENFIVEQNLIPPGSRVLCAVSGGADSICLLHVLCRLRRRFSFSLAAAHFNHQLRGEEADRDAAFVEQFVSLCCGEQRLSDGSQLPAVPLFSGSGDVAAQAALRGTGLEETGRDMRYEFLQRCARESGADLIATAHNADDNLETMLFNLTRGTGLRGLGGIPPARDNIIRPLLTTSRQEVLDYLGYHALPHMEDSTNQSDDYARNRIRHQVLPVLENLVPGVLSRAADTAALLRADEECLTGLAQAIADQAFLRGGELCISTGPLAAAPDPIASRALRLLLRRLWGEDRNCGSAHLFALLRLCREGGPSARLSLPHGFTARREYETLVLAPSTSPASLPEKPLPLPGEETFGPWRLTCRGDTYAGQPQTAWDFWLSQNALSGLTARTRCVGDRLTLSGRPGKTVKKWMIEARLPRLQRDTLPVLDTGGAVAAVAGLGPDQGFLPQPGQKAWHISVTPLK